jgi:hypothetical protein
MATVYEQNFNSLSDGDINGQDSWVDASGIWDVSTTNPYEGAKAVKSTTTTAWVDGKSSRVFSDTPSGIAGIAMRRQSSSSGVFHLRLLDGSNRVATIQIGDYSTGAPTKYTSGTTVTSWFNASYDTYYYFEIEWDATEQKVRYRYNGGEWTSWVNSYASFTAVDRIWFYRENRYGGGGTWYFDDILITSTVAPSSIKTILGLAKASVKTVNGLAIASVKSVNGLE